MKTQITIETPCGVDLDGMAEHCDVMTQMMRQRYEHLKLLAAETTGEKQRNAKLEMQTMTRVMPTHNKLRNAVAIAAAHLRGNKQPDVVLDEAPLDV